MHLMKVGLLLCLPPVDMALYYLCFSGVAGDGTGDGMRRIQVLFFTLQRRNSG